MPEIPDYDLLRPNSPEEPAGPEPSGPKVALWIAAALLVVAGAATIYVVYGRKSSPAPASTAVKPKEATEQAIRPLGSDADQIALPPLNDTDPIVRELVRKLTSHPTALAWLATNGLIRNFTVVVANIVEGVTPARHLRAVKPAGTFQVITRNGQLFIDSKSYERYDGIAAAAASLDPAGTSRLYATLKPRIEEAYAELGAQPSSFDRALERAIVVLLQTPVVDGPIRVEPKGIGYRYSDSKLEGLSAAQKQLLRTGPPNMRSIQLALRQLALALGIPADRLP